MSTDPTDVAALYKPLITSSYALYSTATWVAYEYLITIPDEIDFLWCRKWTGATWIFAANRYLTLANVIYLVTLSPQLTYITQTCNHQWTVKLLDLFIDGVYQFLFVVVLYALRGSLLQFYSFKRPMGWFLILLGVFSFLTQSILQFPRQSLYVALPVRGLSCWLYGDPKNESNDIRSNGSAYFSVLAITFFVISVLGQVAMIALTWIQSLRHVRQARTMKLNISGPSITEMLLRDGSAVFWLNLTVNSVNATFLYDPAMADWTAVGVIIPLLNNARATVLSRFLINLFRVGSGSSNAATEGPLSSAVDNKHSSLRFRTQTID